MCTENKPFTPLKKGTIFLVENKGVLNVIEKLMIGLKSDKKEIHFLCRK